MTLKKVFSGITSVGFSGNLLDTTTNYAVFNPPASWQGQNRLWIKLPKGIWNVTIEYEGNSAFFVDGLLSTPTNKVDKLVYSNGDKAFAVSIQQPSSSSDNVIVGMTKYQDPLSLSLVNAIAYCARRWQHDAKARWFSRPGGVYPYGQWEWVGYPVSIPRPVGGIVKHEYSTRPWPLQSGSPRPQLHHDLQCVPLGIYRRPGNAYRLPGDARIRHTNLHERWRHHHHHTPRLTPVGGDA